jgi:hypothetical protein
MSTDSVFEANSADGSDPFVLSACDSIYVCREASTSFFQRRKKCFAMPIESDEWIANRKTTSFEFHKKSSTTGTAEALLFFNSDLTDFSLRVQDDEIMSFFFRKGVKPPHRTLAVRVGALELVSAPPHSGPCGGWVLNLGGRPALRSRKNCRLEGPDSTPVVFIRKPRKGELEVQSSDDGIGEMLLFALCVGSFVCRL